MKTNEIILKIVLEFSKFAGPGPNFLLLVNSFSFLRRLKGPELEVAHSLPTREEVKNEWSYTSPSSIYLNNVHRDKFTSNVR